MIERVRRSLSLKLGLAIVTFTALVFLVTLGYFFYRSRQLVRQEAMERATKMLDKTTLRVTGYLSEIETATHNLEWFVLHNPVPDSLLSFTHRVVALNPDVNGCSITMSPDFFPPAIGRFSAYSIRSEYTIITQREKDYDYYDKDWYKKPVQMEQPCWIDPYDDYNSGTLSSPDMIASYSLPLYSAKPPKLGGHRGLNRGMADASSDPQPPNSGGLDASSSGNGPGNSQIVKSSNSKIIGVISTDLSLRRLSQTISEDRPYPHSYSIMLARNGQYLIHPDTTKMFTTSIFSDVDPEAHPDIITLGHEMLSGKDSCMQVNINKQTCFVFYQPVPQTGWSIALVCPQTDILAPYTNLQYTIIAIIAIGLLLMLYIIMQTVSHFIKPLTLLHRQARHIARLAQPDATDDSDDETTTQTSNHKPHNSKLNSPDDEEHMPYTARRDLVGQLQNSFATMQESLNKNIGQLKQANRQAQLKNQQLLTANRQAQESSKKLIAFVQDMSHQIRTPLNIILGFLTALRDNRNQLTQQEVDNITLTAQQNAHTLVRMAQQLYHAAQLENPDLDVSVNDKVNPNSTARKALDSIFPGQLNVKLKTTVPDNFTFNTNQQHLFGILSELLFNARKYAPEAPVTLAIDRDDKYINFAVEDHGPGIPEAHRDTIFQHFNKIDPFSEGLGLGLNLSQKYISLMGGQLLLDPTYTHGSRFILKLKIVK